MNRLDTRNTVTSQLDMYNTLTSQLDTYNTLTSLHLEGGSSLTLQMTGIRKGDLFVTSVVAWDIWLGFADPHLNPMLL